MKVLFVSSGNSHYGIVPFVKSQGESLKKEGVELDYFTIKGKGFIGYLKNIKPLKRFIKKNNYDIIHAHYGLIGLVCLLTFSTKPLVLSVMGSDAYGSFDTKGKRILSSYLDMLLTQLVLPFVKQIIVKSKNLYDFVPYKKKSNIIPNGVNLEVYRPNGNTLPKDKVLWLANPNDPRKNFQLLREALELLKNKEIELISPFPIKPIEFPSYLNRSSVFVLTSYNEGSPNVIKEAMACNIPIVSTDVGDVKEVFGNTEGCYITTFEPEDVAEKIKLALEFARKKGRTKGRERLVKLGLDSETVAKRIIGVYEKVLNIE